jgi:hypothetical protein
MTPKGVLHKNRSVSKSDLPHDESRDHFEKPAGLLDPHHGFSGVLEDLLIILAGHR